MPFLHLVFSFILLTKKVCFSFPRPIPAPWCPPPSHGQSTWPAFCPSLSHQCNTVGSDLLPHAPGSAILVFPAARRPDVLVSMSCLWLEHKYLPGEHHHELFRRMLSTLALGNLVLSHSFPPMAVYWDSQVMDCDIQKRKEELLFPIPFCSYCGSAKAFTSMALNIVFLKSVFVFCMRHLPLA